ncbi:regulatory protein GemA [Fundidesulfovibrio butyratiphilus]
MRVESRNSLLAKVHIAKKALGLDKDPETYRALLARVAGVESSGDCTVAQLTRVVAEFRRLGWQAAPARKAAAPKPARHKAPLMGKITALLAEAKRPDAYADAIARRIYKRDSLAFCTVRELQGVVAALVKDAKRHGRPT